jgi:hypothetical protein
MNEHEVQEILKSHRDHPQIACTKYLELNKRESIAEPISHPNQYFEVSLGNVSWVKEVPGR